jgi:16S rRNA A1518/A1519 N6-dimethyltransferase RsmA/KsgA/DIM1 with predicted DNA glycosylase/AP lyase activity
MRLNKKLVCYEVDTNMEQKLAKLQKQDKEMEIVR